MPHRGFQADDSPILVSIMRTRVLDADAPRALSLYAGEFQTVIRLRVGSVVANVRR